MLDESSSFSRARILLQRAGNGTSAHTGAGEAGVFLGSGTDSTGKLACGAGLLDALVQSLKARPEIEVVADQRSEGTSGAFGAWPAPLDPRIASALRGREMAVPFRHQAQALAALWAERDVVIATGTASGKSLCFQVPIAQAVLGDPNARALCLFPTKALARDQCESMRELVRHLGPTAALGVAPYDGDTPPDQRRAARSRAHMVATNPDMLHRGILPMHEGWGRFLAGLRYVVLDEVHTYRGLFGAHVANVLRRLWRVCAHYGARPQVIACSATIANPKALAEALTGRSGFECVDEDTAPKGSRRFVVLNPRVVDPVVGVRRDYLKVTRIVASEIRRAGVQSLVFCRTRKAVELMTRYLQDDERSEGGSAAAAQSAIRGYRGGYLPERRREVEQALRSGQARMVATTHALELGIDVGGMDVVVLSGYPGSRAAMVQRAGRAGRRGQDAVCVMVLSSLPTDQFIAADPAFVLGRGVEQAAVDPDNPEVLLPHLRCAAQELPLSAKETWGSLATQEVAGAIAYLVEHGILGAQPADAQGTGEVFAALGADAAADQVELRGPMEENFTVVDGTGDILAEVDHDDAALYLHPGAIYPVEGQTYEVRELDWDGRKAYVRAVNSQYYTEAIANLRVRMIDAGQGVGAETANESAGVGEAHVVRTVPGFKKIRFDTHENIGFGPVSLPDLELHTRAAFWPLPSRVYEVLDPVARASAALAAGHALHRSAALMLMCEWGDLGHAVTPGHPASFGAVATRHRGPEPDTVLAAMTHPYILLFDRIAGGAGFASAAFDLGSALFEQARVGLLGCKCRQGCPSCLGPGVFDDQDGVDRNSVVLVLEALAMGGGR